MWKIQKMQVSTLILFTYTDLPLLFKVHEIWSVESWESH